MAAGLWTSFDSSAWSGGETRTLSLYHVHTGQSLTITYKQNGKYIPSAMKKINYVLRDWRRNEVITIDPRTIDLMWELHADLGSRRPVHIVSGYRSPKTNAFLKRIGRNVARKSQHMVGKAIDIYFPDVPTEKIRNSALVRKVGGVGYYRSGGGPTGFVHIDSGKVRHWGPGISSSQMARIMRDYRKTVGARTNKKAMIAVADTGGAPESNKPSLYDTVMKGGTKSKAKRQLDTDYSSDDEEMAELSANASAETEKAKVKLQTEEPADGEAMANEQAVVADVAPEGVVKAYPVPKPRPKPIEVLMMAAVNMKIEPASAPPPTLAVRQKPSPVSDGMGVVIAAETMTELSGPESNTAAKGSLASQLVDGTTSEVPVIRTITASAAGEDLFWWPKQVIFNSDQAVRRDGEPQTFADTGASLLPGIDDAAAETMPALPKLAVAAVQQQPAAGKSDMLVVNREGKGSLMEDAPALKAKRLKLGQLESQ